jgi:hypothetical protein
MGNENISLYIYIYIYIYLEQKNQLHVKQCIFYVVMSMIVRLIMDKVDNVNVTRNIYSRPPRNNFNDLASSYFLWK